MSERVKVLVTGGEHFGGLAAARALARAGFKTVVAVTTESSYAAKSRAASARVLVPDPALGAEPFAEALAEASETFAADVVLPGTDVGLSALAAYRDRFPDTVAVGVCDPETVERATSKAALAALGSAAGIAVPATQTIARADLAGSKPIEITFPAVVKTLRSDVVDAGGTLVHAGAFRVRDAEQLEEIVEGLPGERWVVQPYLEGDLVAVGGVASDGALVAAVHQVAERIWPLDCGGSSYAMTIPPDPAREQRVRRFVAELGWTGIFQLQVLRRGDEEFLIDFNPRFYGTLGLALAAGVNLPRLWVQLLLGRTPQPLGTYKVGVRYRAQLNDTRAIAALAQSGSWREAARGLLPVRRTCHPVVAWNDPLPVLAGWKRVRRKVAAATEKSTRCSPRRPEVDKPSRKS